MELIEIFTRDSEDRPFSVKELNHNARVALSELYSDSRKSGIVIPRGLTKTKLWAIGKALLGFTPQRTYDSPGRPKFKFDYAQIHDLASIMCTDAEMALICGCSIDAVVRAKKHDPEFISSYYRGKGLALVSLRRKQWVIAMGEVAPNFLIDELNKIIKAGKPISNETLESVIEQAKLTKNCDKGHPTMLIFLGKNELGQTDQMALTHSSSVSLQDALKQVDDQLKSNPALRVKLENELQD